MWARFLVLQLTGAALVVAAWLAGWLDAAFAGPARWALIVLSAALMASVILIWRERYAAARWLAGNMTAMGLIGTVAGLIHATGSLTDQNAWAVLAGAGLAWYSTGMGIAGWLWLRLSLAVVGEDR